MRDGATSGATISATATVTVVPIAWTWHALIGTTVTVAVALMVAPLVAPSRTSSAPA